MLDLTKNLLEVLETILKKGNQAEVKIEHGQVVVIEIKRRKVNIN